MSQHGADVGSQRPGSIPFPRHLLLAGDGRQESGNLPGCKRQTQTESSICIGSSEGKGKVGLQTPSLPDGNKFSLISHSFWLFLCLQDPGSVVSFILCGSSCGSPTAPYLAWGEVHGPSAPLLSSSWGISFRGLNVELVRLEGWEAGMRYPVFPHKLFHASTWLVILESPCSRL